MNFETYLNTVLDCHLTEVKDEIKESIVKKILEYKAERPQGEWLFAEEYGTHYCSNCKHFAFNDWLFNYCPDCGAKMRKGEKE